MSTFAMQIRQFAEKAKTNADLVVRKVVADVANEIVTLSPVGDGNAWQTPPPKGYVGGRFRANWQLGINVSPSGELADIDPTGQKALSRIMERIPTNAMGQVFYIMNNLPYAQRLEDGWSKQAPEGMVMKTVIRWNVIVDNAVNGVRDGGGDMAAGFQAYPL